MSRGCRSLQPVEIMMMMAMMVMAGCDDNDDDNDDDYYSHQPNPLITIYLIFMFNMFI